MDSSNLNIFSELSSLGGDSFLFLTRHLIDGLQAEHGEYFLCMTSFFCLYNNVYLSPVVWVVLPPVLSEDHNTNRHIKYNKIEKIKTIIEQCINFLQNHQTGLEKRSNESKVGLEWGLREEKADQSRGSSHYWSSAKPWPLIESSSSQFWITTEPWSNRNEVITLYL